MTKQEFFHRPNKRFFIEDLAKTAAYAKSVDPEAAAHAIQTADNVASQCFLFDARWDMERTYEPVSFGGQIDWLYQPQDDPEWCYQMNRHRYWISLGQAYAMTGKEQYALAFAAQLRDWVARVARQESKNAAAWRAIEAGLRLEYWLKAFCYFENSSILTDEFCGLFEAAVIDHAEFLMEANSSFQLVSNWGVLQNHGLFLAGVMLPESPRTRQYREEALRRLAEEISIQVYDDGVHWEQSPMYHNEVLHDFLDVKLLADRNGITLPKPIPQKLQAMCYATLYHTKPDHTELTMGDSDSIDTRDLLTVAAALFRDPVLKHGAYALPDFDSAWELGVQAVEAYQRMEARQPQETAIALSSAGNYSLRSGWGEQDSLFHFHCGPIGGGHAHADQLHVDLFANGEDILVDAGRYTYVDKPERYEFKRADAHNTITVDDQDFLVSIDAWSYAKLSHAPFHRMIMEESYGYFEGANLGYGDLPGGGVLILRKVVVLKPDLYLLADELYTTGEHTYHQYFHFHSAGRVSAFHDRDFQYGSQKNTVQLCLLGGDIRGEVTNTRVSRHYNQLEQNQTVKTTFSGKGFVSAYSLVSVNPAERLEPVEFQRLPVTDTASGKPFQEEQIEGFAIRKGKQNYTVVIAHGDYLPGVGSFTVNGCIGLGHVVVFDRTAGESRVGKVLVW